MMEALVSGLLFVGPHERNGVLGSRDHTCILGGDFQCAARLRADGANHGFSVLQPDMQRARRGDGRDRGPGDRHIAGQFRLHG